jgi:hypothetical protein
VTWFGDIKVVTPGGKPPRDNGNGTFTLPGGGIATLPSGTSVTVPVGSSIRDDGVGMFLPRGLKGAGVLYSDGYTERVQPGFIIELYEKEVSLSSLPVYLPFPFGDVERSAWYFGDVVYIYIHNIMNGTGEYLFSPDLPMTRGMVLSVLYRLAGEPAASG